MRYTFFTFLILIFCGDASASQYYDEVFSVRDVKVAARGASAVEAEKKAMKMAKEKAFRMLMGRLLSEENMGEVANISPEKLEEYVDSVEVTSQQNSKISYQATMTVHFDGPSIQRLLGGRMMEGQLMGEGHAGQAIEHSQPPLVVIPIYIDQGSINLWGEQNPWLNAWANREKFGIATPIQVPLGDLQDVSSVDGSQVMRGEISALSELARRYSASGVVIAILRRDSKDPMAPMSVEASLLNLDGQMRPLFHSATMTGANSQKMQYEQAINIVVQQLESHVRNAGPSQMVNAANEIVTRIQFADQKEWLSIQNAMRDSMVIKQMTLQSLSRHEATVVFTFQGSLATLESTFSAKGFQLEQIDGNTWLLRRVAAPTYMPY